MAKKLLPPKDFRWTIPHVCAHCRFCVYDDGLWYCKRSGDNPDNATVGGDSGDGFQHERTCDRWEKQKGKGK